MSLMNWIVVISSQITSTVTFGSTEDDLLWHWDTKISLMGLDIPHCIKARLYPCCAQTVSLCHYVSQCDTVSVCLCSVGPLGRWVAQSLRCWLLVWVCQYDIVPLRHCVHAWLVTAYLDHCVILWCCVSTTSLPLAHFVIALLCHLIISRITSSSFVIS